MDGSTLGAAIAILKPLINDVSGGAADVIERAVSAMEAAEAAAQRASDDQSSARSAASAARQAVLSANSSATNAQSAANSAAASKTTADTSATSAAASASTATAKLNEIQELTESISNMSAAITDNVALAAQSVSIAKEIQDNAVIGTNLGLMPSAEDHRAFSKRPGGEGIEACEYKTYTVVGGSIIWNQLVDTNSSSVTVPDGHKYVSKIGSQWSVNSSDGTSIAVTGATDQIFDLTVMFGKTIADSVYAMEQTNSGDGVAWFRKYFYKTSYAYDAGTFMNTQTSAHNVTDKNNAVTEYALDDTVVLKGIPKLDSNNQLTYDGDTYNCSGDVLHRFAAVDLGTENWVKVNNSNVPGTLYYRIALPDRKSGSCPFVIYGDYQPATGGTSALTSDKTISMSTSNTNLVIRDDSCTSASQMIDKLNGVMIVYELATPVSATAEPYSLIQKIDPEGYEEFVDARNGDVMIPTGIDAKYYQKVMKVEDVATIAEIKSCLQIS